MRITIWTRDGRQYVAEAENKEVGTLATDAAAQTDDHRDVLWTLTYGGRQLEPSASAEAESLVDGAYYELAEYSPPSPGIIKRALKALGVTS